MKLELPQGVERAVRRMTLVVGILTIAFVVSFVLLRRNGRDDLLAYVDVPLHLFGGYFVALAFVLLVLISHSEKVFLAMPYWLRVTLVLGFTALVTILWELFEHVTDTWLGTTLQSTVIETLKDIVVGLLGAAPVALILTRRRVLIREVEARSVSDSSLANG